MTNEQREQRLTVDTRRIRVLMANGFCVSGDTFVQLQGSHLSGGQRVEDLLNGDESFLPLRNEFGTQLVNLEQIVSVSVAAAEELDPLLTLGRKYAVRVEPTVGDGINVCIYVNLPGSASRVKDFLNQKKRFLLFIDGDQVLYIARDKILRVID